VDGVSGGDLKGVNLQWEGGGESEKDIVWRVPASPELKLAGTRKIEAGGGIEEVSLESVGERKKTVLWRGRLRWK